MRRCSALTPAMAGQCRSPDGSQLIVSARSRRRANIIESIRVVETPPTGRRWCDDACVRRRTSECGLSSLVAGSVDGCGTTRRTKTCHPHHHPEQQPVRSRLSHHGHTYACHQPSLSLSCLTSIPLKPVHGAATLPQLQLSTSMWPMVQSEHVVSTRKVSMKLMHVTGKTRKGEASAGT